MLRFPHIWIWLRLSSWITFAGGAAAHLSHLHGFQISSINYLMLHTKRFLFFFFFSFFAFYTTEEPPTFWDTFLAHPIFLYYYYYVMASGTMCFTQSVNIKSNQIINQNWQIRYLWIKKEFDSSTCVHNGGKKKADSSF